MRGLPIVVASSLPSLIIPCPRCALRMTYRATAMEQAEPTFQDTIFACEQCGTEVVRTSFRAFDPQHVA